MDLTWPLSGLSDPSVGLSGLLGSPGMSGASQAPLGASPGMPAPTGIGMTGGLSLDELLKAIGGDSEMAPGAGLGQALGSTPTSVAQQQASGDLGSNAFSYWGSLGGPGGGGIGAGGQPIGGPSGGPATGGPASPTITGGPSTPTPVPSPSSGAGSSVDPWTVLSKVLGVTPRVAKELYDSFLGSPPPTPTASPTTPAPSSTGVPEGITPEFTDPGAAVPDLGPAEFTDPGSQVPDFGLGGEFTDPGATVPDFGPPEFTDPGAVVPDFGLGGGGGEWNDFPGLGAGAGDAAGGAAGSLGSGFADALARLGPSAVAAIIPYVGRLAGLNETGVRVLGGMLGIATPAISAGMSLGGALGPAAAAGWAGPATGALVGGSSLVGAAAGGVLAPFIAMGMDALTDSMSPSFSQKNFPNSLAITGQTQAASFRQLMDQLQMAQTPEQVADAVSAFKGAQAVYWPEELRNQGGMFELPTLPASSGEKTKPSGSGIFSMPGLPTPKYDFNPQVIAINQLLKPFADRYGASMAGYQPKSWSASGGFNGVYGQTPPGGAYDPATGAVIPEGTPVTDREMAIQLGLPIPEQNAYNWKPWAETVGIDPGGMSLFDKLRNSGNATAAADPAAAPIPPVDVPFNVNKVAPVGELPMLPMDESISALPPAGNDALSVLYALMGPGGRR